MDGLLVKNIPRVLLARILVQLYIIPQHLINSSQFDLLAVLVAGLRDYGDSDDLDGFLYFCARKSFSCLETTPSTSDAPLRTPSTWIWRDHTLDSLSDWDRIDQDQLEEQDSQNRCDTTLDKATSMIGLRLQVASEKARPQIELTRYGKKVATLHDERFTCVYEGQYISVENILNGALEYMSNRQPPSTELSSSSSTTTTTITTTTTTATTTTAAAAAAETETAKHTNTHILSTLLKQRIQELEKDRREYEQKFTGRSETDFVLMGALMVKLDATVTNGAMEDDWYLYLRDYTIDISGSNWRIIKGSMTTATDEVEMRVSSHQVLADLRGIKVKNDQGLECVPSPTSNNYRPVYLFYCNNDIVSRSAQDSLEMKSGATPFENSHDNEATTSSTVGQNITFEDYSLENDNENGNNMDYEMQVEDDDDDLAMEMCKLCGIPESIDDINTIFFCDECNLGVHQLCEQPPIAAFEMDIDPWYCRDCCARKGIPLPTPPHYITPRSEATTTPTTTAATTTTDPVLQLETTTTTTTTTNPALQFDGTATSTLNLHQSHQPLSPPTPTSTTTPTMTKPEIDDMLSPTATAGNDSVPSNGTELDKVDAHVSSPMKRKLDD